MGKYSLYLLNTTFIINMVVSGLPGIHLLCTFVSIHLYIFVDLDYCADKFPHTSFKTENYYIHNLIINFCIKKVISGV